MKLVYKDTGKPVVRDDIVNVNGHHYVVDTIEAPKTPASTGRVYVRPRFRLGTPIGYYPSVFDMEWVPEKVRLFYRTVECTEVQFLSAVLATAQYRDTSEVWPVAQALLTAFMSGELPPEGLSGQVMVLTGNQCIMTVERA